MTQGCFTWGPSFASRTLARNSDPQSSHLAAEQAEKTFAQRHRESIPPGPERWKNRSRTFQGVADAMADQWGGGGTQQPSIQTQQEV